MTKTKVKNLLASRFITACGLLEEIEYKLLAILDIPKCYISYNNHYPKIDLLIYWSNDQGSTVEKMEIVLEEDEFTMEESQLIDLIVDKVSICRKAQ